MNDMFEDQQQARNKGWCKQTNSDYFLAAYEQYKKGKINITTAAYMCGWSIPTTKKHFAEADERMISLKLFNDINPQTGQKWKRGERTDAKRRKKNERERKRYHKKRKRELKEAEKNKRKKK